MFMFLSFMGDQSMIDCRGCKYCFMEPDDDLCCGHPNYGTWGKYVRVARDLDGICGPEAKLYEKDPRESRKQFQE